MAWDQPITPTQPGRMPKMMISLYFPGIQLIIAFGDGMFFQVDPKKLPRNSLGKVWDSGFLPPVVKSLGVSPVKSLTSKIFASGGGSVDPGLWSPGCFVSG